MTAGFQSLREVVEVVDGGPYFAEIETRFGIPAAGFRDYLVLRRNAKCLALARRHVQVPLGLDVLAFGMPFLYVKMRHPRLTTAAAIKFGPLATRNVVDLDDDQAAVFLHRRQQPLTPQQAARLTGPGYVLVRQGGMIFGLGHVRPEGDGMTLAGTVPRSWRERLA